MKRLDWMQHVVVTPWKINGWNLQPSPMKRKESMIWTKLPGNYVPAVHLPGCTCLLGYVGSRNHPKNPGLFYERKNHLQNTKKKFCFLKQLGDFTLPSYCMVVKKIQETPLVRCFLFFFGRGEGTHSTQLRFSAELLATYTAANHWPRRSGMTCASKLKFQGMENGLPMNFSAYIYIEMHTYKVILYVYSRYFLVYLLACSSSFEPFSKRKNLSIFHWHLRAPHRVRGVELSVCCRNRWKAM